ncbi:lecithin retinol acyltransferase family protein [Aeromicrobium sp.]|uniref:lecithin retinol acyltransferase family protein n=1 Tax=Aeromicrobium sp. TaxID=1871063 RepID=UPI002FC90E9C
MSRGDHVYVHRRCRYSHHGIDCGDGTVIHYVGTWGKARRVERTSLDSFAKGAEVLVRQYRRRLPVDEILDNAESRLSSQGYHLFRNNCEHFATWASTGSASSSQVRGWAVAAPGAAASVGVADAAGAPLILLGSLGMGIYALVKPLRRRRRAILAPKQRWVRSDPLPQPEPALPASR